MAEPALKLNFLSHGTLESRDLDRAREFYEAFFGLDVVRTSDRSLMIKLGGNHTYAVVLNPKKGTMPVLAHNGFDVATEAEVDACHRIVCEQAEKWNIGKITKPVKQHGTYSFYFWDLDENCWEILSNPEGGYCWLFERGDQEGRGHLDRSFTRPETTRS